MKGSLAYARLNLFANPFGELTDEEAIEFAVIDARPFRDALQEPRAALQLRGNHGRGKSTLLRLLAAEKEAPLLRGGHRPPIPRRSQPFLAIDEAQLLSPWRRRRLLRRTERVILSTHRDLSKELEREGFTPISLEPPALDLQRLREIVSRRIEGVRRSTGPILAPEDALLTRLLAEHGNDCRAILRHLYHHVLELRNVRDAEARTLHPLR